MRRKTTGRSAYQATVGNIKSELSQRQLAAVGLVAMNYNEMESWIDMLLLEVLQPPDELALEMSTRIHGIEGKIGIITRGAQSLGFSPEVLRQMGVTLGDGGFKLLKKFRDAVVHARVFNAPLGIGMGVGRRAEVYEVLLTADALEALAEYLNAMRKELLDLGNLFIAARVLNDRAADDPERERLEASKARLSARFLAHQPQKQSLRRLPEFPSEPELLAARDAWYLDQKEAIMQWVRELTDFYPLAPPKKD